MSNEVLNIHLFNKCQAKANFANIKLASYESFFAHSYCFI